MADDIPQWAKERAVELANGSRNARFGSWRVEDVLGDATMQAFARYIAAHEEPPVDPLVAEAERLLVEWKGEVGNFAIVCLKRGMELAK